MLSVIFIDKARNQLGFISDAADQAAQVMELNDPANENLISAAKEHLGLTQPGISDTTRAQYDVTNKVIARSAAEIHLQKRKGGELRSAHLVTFDSLFD